MIQSSSSNSQNGNVVVFILLGVVLFGALIFTFTKSGQQGTSRLSKQEAKIVAQDIISFANTLNKAVDRVRQDGCSESQINFNDSAIAGYENLSAPGTRCDIFDNDAGQAIYITPPSKAGTAIEWTITGANIIEGAGAIGNGDLSLILRNVNLETCNAINSLLGIQTADSLPPSDNTTPSYTKFVGSFGTGAAINDLDPDLNGRLQGCVNLTTPGEYIFYSVMLDR